MEKKRGREGIGGAREYKNKEEKEGMMERIEDETKKA